MKKTKRIPVVSVPFGLDDAEVQCPYCGGPRTVEIDANYVVTCDNCGRKYRIVSEF
jgi:uncharacterized Zn-finger protein